ncbi:unnamed protein product [Paramecium sonneborni]|uniref:Uncharacterized protein n=1 Tax=Paramecium sonneborni TaxID=65129 RepID=A0A8S1REA1_9CILI|nr:unnamed protein product [Paramecium sonneborni]
MEPELQQMKGFFNLRPELIGKIYDFIEYKQLLEFRFVSRQADQTVQSILQNRLHKANKEVERLEGLMDPIKQYVYGELAGELNNEFITTRMNIINAVNKMDFKSQQFKDAFEKNPVGLKITEYLKLLFNDNYETLWRFQVQAISEEQFAQLHQILEIENELQGSPQLCQEMYKVFQDIIKLRSMRFMNEWHKQYKIDVVCDQWLDKKAKIEAILARIRQTEIEKQFKDK